MRMGISNLEVSNYYCYTIDEQRATAHKVVDLDRVEKPLNQPAKYREWFFLCLCHYSHPQNLRINVSNERRNMANAMRSLKSKDFLSISLTSILLLHKMKANHPVTRLLTGSIVIETFHFNIIK